MRIGILSDTHGWLDEPVMDFLASVDQVWHAGDVGNVEVTDRLKAWKPLRAVYGNIDGAEVRADFVGIERFECEGVDVLMTHIGGYPGHYDKLILPTLHYNPPALFVCGHSHILRIMYDQRYRFLSVNPGAAGKYGFHKVRTAVRLTLEQGNIKDLEIGEWPKNG